MLRALFVFSGLLLSLNSQARVLAPIIQLGVDAGGDSLHVPGDPTSFDLRANTGVFISAGTILRVSDTFPHAFEAQITLGYKFAWDSDEDNGDINWRHIPIELMYFYKNKRNGFRMGYGASYYLSSKLKGEKSRASVHRNYKNKLGYVLALEKIIDNPNSQELASYGIRYNLRSFEPEGFGPTKSGDSFGFYVTIGFP